MQYFVDSVTFLWLLHVSTHKTNIAADRNKNKIWLKKKTVTVSTFKGGWIV